MITINLNPFPELATTRLLLRQLQLNDANEIFSLRSDDNINAFIDRQKATSIDEAAAFINKIIAIQNNGEGLMWAITLQDDPKLIGSIGIWNIVKEKAEAEIGYELLPQYQRKGIMLEALKAAINYAFETIGLKTIVAESNKNNQRSISLLQKCGFTETDEIDGDYLIYKLSNNK